MAKEKRKKKKRSKQRQAYTLYIYLSNRIDGTLLAKCIASYIFGGNLVGGNMFLVQGEEKK